MASGSHPSTWATYVSATHRLRQQLRRANGLIPMVHRLWYRCTQQESFIFAHVVVVLSCLQLFNQNKLAPHRASNQSISRKRLASHLCFQLSALFTTLWITFSLEPSPRNFLTWTWVNLELALDMGMTQPSTPMELLPLKWNPGTSSHWNGLVIFGTPWLGLLS
jgi:hypothetical protein